MQLVVDEPGRKVVICPQETKGAAEVPHSGTTQPLAELEQAVVSLSPPTQLVESVPGRGTSTVWGPSLLSTSRDLEGHVVAEGTVPQWS